MLVKSIMHIFMMHNYIARVIGIKELFKNICLLMTAWNWNRTWDQTGRRPEVGRKFSKLSEVFIQNIKSLLLNPLNRRDRLRNLFVNFLLSRTKNKLYLFLNNPIIPICHVAWFLGLIMGLCKDNKKNR